MTRRDAIAKATADEMKELVEAVGTRNKEMMDWIGTIDSSQELWSRCSTESSTFSWMLLVFESFQERAV